MRIGGAAGQPPLAQGVRATGGRAPDPTWPTKASPTESFRKDFSRKAGQNPSGRIPSGRAVKILPEGFLPEGPSKSFRKDSFRKGSARFFLGGRAFSWGVACPFFCGRVPFFGAWLHFSSPKSFRKDFLGGSGSLCLPREMVPRKSFRKDSVEAWRTGGGNMGPPPLVGRPSPPQDGGQTNFPRGVLPSGNPPGRNPSGGSPSGRIPAGREIPPGGQVQLPGLPAPAPWATTVLPGAGAMLEVRLRIYGSRALGGGLAEAIRGQRPGACGADL